MSVVLATSKKACTYEYQLYLHLWKSIHPAHFKSAGLVKIGFVEISSKVII